MTIKNQKGIALVIAMCTVLMMALVAQLFTLIIVNSRHNAQKEWNTTSALYIAKAGANLAIREWQKVYSITDTTGYLLDGTYTYKSVTDGTNNWIDSKGTTHGESQTVRIAYGTSSSSGGPDLAFDYGVFTDGIQDYKGGGNPHYSIVSNADVHSNNSPPCSPNQYPTVNNPSHDIVGTGYEVEKTPNSLFVDFPKLNVRYDSIDSTKHYYDGTLEISNDYWHTATLNGTSNGDSNNHYYHDFSDTKLPSAYQSSNITTSPTMPTNSGVTLIISNSATPPTIEIDDGTGTLIIIGANAEFKTGNNTFNGLIFVEKNKSNVGGDLAMKGNTDIYGAIICRNLVVSAGTPRVYYTPDNFKNTTKSEGKTASLKLFSWQAEY